MNLKYNHATVQPAPSEDEVGPPAYDQIQAADNINQESVDTTLVLQSTTRKSSRNMSLRKRNRLSRMTKWMRQSVNSLTALDESCRSETFVGGMNKRWRWGHQKRTSTLQRELQTNPMLPFECIKEKNVEMLKELLKHHQTIIHQTDSKGSYLIHHAVMAGNLECVELLISFGADINKEDAKGNRPIHLVAISGDLELFEYLLALHVDVCCVNHYGEQPIHLVAKKDHTALLERLLKCSSVNIEARGDRGETAVHYCCAEDSVNCLNILIAHGAQIYVPNKHHFYPIHIALENLSHNCLRVLFETEEYLRSPAPVALHSLSSTHMSDSENLESSKGSQRKSNLLSNLPVVESYSAPKLSLNNLVDSEGDTPLHTAVRTGDLVGIKICLDHGASILVVQHERETPVHYACSKSDLEAVKIMLESCPSQVKLVMSMVNKSGYTPLHLATLYDNVPLLDYLVNQGASLEQTNSAGLTALLLGATKGSFYACHRLIDLGANVMAKDTNERNIIHLTAFNALPGMHIILHPSMDEVAKTLIFQKDIFGCTPLHYAAETGNFPATEYVLSHGLTLLDRNAQGDTPLHIAADHGYYRIVRLMLETSEGIRALYHEDNLGRIPLHRAVMRGHPRTTQLLLQKGGIFRKCHKGNTPLHTAAQNGQFETCQVLLKLSPALMDQTNFEGETALHAAAINNHSEIVEYLLTAGAQILPTNHGCYFVCMAIEQRHHETLKVTIMHPRWGEISNILDGTSRNVLDGLIRELPSLFGLVMSRSITRSKDEITGCVNVSYDFSVLQQQTSDADGKINDPMHRVKLIAKLQRRELIFHPLCTTYLDMKWKLYGRWIQLIQITYFLMLLAAVTWYVVTDDLKYTTKEPNQKIANMTLIGKTLHAVFLLCLTIHLTLEISKLKKQHLDYFRDWLNTLSLVMYLAGETLLIDALFDKSLPARKTLATVFMFLVWLNCLLQITHVKFVGIFIVMFLQVFGTVVKCIFVYSIVILSFGFTFHVLFRDSEVGFRNRNATLSVVTRSASYRQRLAMGDVLTERDQYNYLTISLFKTLMMMFGEYEHSSTLIHPLLSDPNPDVHSTIAIFGFYIAFLLFVPITVMNLLIGLAVGDIEEVRKTACQQLLIQQIYWLADLESKCPRFIQKRLAKKVLQTSQSGRLHSKKHNHEEQEKPFDPHILEARLNKIERLAQIHCNILQNMMEKFEIISYKKHMKSSVSFDSYAGQSKKDNVDNENALNEK